MICRGKVRARPAIPAAALARRLHRRCTDADRNRQNGKMTQMRKTSVRSTIAVAALALSIGCANAQWGIGGYPDIPDSPLCSDYIRAWIAMAKDAEARECSPGGPVWSTVVKEQADFCLSAGTDANNARTEAMRYTLYGGSASLCAGCANIVDKVFHSVVDNVLYNCGFSNSDGRWSTSRESQIARCYAAAHPGGRLSKIEEFFVLRI